MATKIKKKKWYQIVAPQMFRNQVIGESLVTEGSLLIGRSISANLMSLTNDMKKQNVNVQFYINEIHNNQAKTVIKSYDLIPASIKRLVRRNRNKVDDSFVIKSKEGVSMRIKPLMTTRSRCSNSVTTDIRQLTREFLTEYASKVDYTNFFNDVVFNKVQKNLKHALNKVYPMKIVDIKSVKLVTSGKDVKDSEVKIPERKPRPDRRPSRDSRPVRKEEKPVRKPAESKSE